MRRTCVPPHGCRSTGAVSSPIRTRRIRPAPRGGWTDKVRTRDGFSSSSASLIQRYAAPEEVANMICYVCSKASAATNGAALRVDGGIVTNPF